MRLGSVMAIRRDRHHHQLFAACLPLPWLPSDVGLHDDGRFHFSEMLVEALAVTGEDRLPRRAGVGRFMALPSRASPRLRIQLDPSFRWTVSRDDGILGAVWRSKAR